MESIIKTIGSAMLIACVFAISPLIGVAIGAFSGWVVGFYFTDLILDFLSRFGVDTAGLEVWHVGAALGFLGSFFRSTTTHSGQ